MNIRQYDILKDLLDLCKQIVYENEASGNIDNISTKILYMTNLLAEFQKNE